MYTCKEWKNNFFYGTNTNGERMCNEHGIEFQSEKPAAEQEPEEQKSAAEKEQQEIF